jgi:glycosyltransferase involved in cell wall biosynthesis
MKTARLDTPSQLVTERANRGKSLAVARILHINSGNLYGGVETILTTVARSRDLCPGMESHYALCHEGRLSGELRAAGAPVYLVGNVRLSRPWTASKARRKLREVLRRERFDLVICHMPWSLAVFGGAVRAERQPLGFWAHALHSGRHWLELLARRTPPDLAIANSHFTEAGLVKLFPHSSRAVVYAPVALMRAPEEQNWRSQLRAEYGVGENTAVIVQVSRLEACKGHFQHLEALAGLKKLQAPWECWMVGGPQRAEEHEYLARLRSRAAELGLEQRIRFLGQRSDVKQLLAASDIFCQPNLTPDSFGLSFVEALWARRPVVTTALGGAREIVNDACGFLVAPGDVSGIARSLEQLIENPELRARLGSAGAERATELCDPARQLELLSQLARAGKRAGGGRS